MKPRCGKAMRAYRLARRVRSYDFGEQVPVCGMPEGHERYGPCVSEEALARLSRQRKFARVRRAA